MPFPMGQRVVVVSDVKRHMLTRAPIGREVKCVTILGDNLVGASWGEIVKAPWNEVYFLFISTPLLVPGTINDLLPSVCCTIP